MCHFFCLYVVSPLSSPLRSGDSSSLSKSAETSSTRYKARPRRGLFLPIYASSVAFLWVALVGLIGSRVDAQSTSIALYGGTARVRVPKPSTSSNHQDATAFKELAQHQLAVGGFGAWQGMKGTGFLTYTSANLGPYTATFTISGSDCYRLDVDMPNGTRSIRFMQNQGRTQNPDATVQIITGDTALLGFMQYPLLRAPFDTETSTQILDGGLVSVDGRSLHMVTVELRPNVHPESPQPSPQVVDFYFDPTTHELVESATVVSLPNTGNQTFLREVQYSDYRPVNGVQIPFRYAELINGQPDWALQLNAVVVSPQLEASFFSF